MKRISGAITVHNQLLPRRLTSGGDLKVARNQTQGRVPWFDPHVNYNCWLFANYYFDCMVTKVNMKPHPLTTALTRNSTVLLSEDTYSQWLLELKIIKVIHMHRYVAV